MKPIHYYCVKPQETIFQTMKVIEQGAIQLAFVVGEDQKLQGVVSDGNIRRGLLNGLSLQDSVSKVMNPNPVIVSPSESQSKILHKFQTNSLRVIPVVDQGGQLVRIETLENLLGFEARTNTVVIMAGGKGMRLRPLTENCPKPLVKLGEEAIIDHVFRNLVEAGFSQFILSVNYLKQMMIDYCGNGSKWGINIEYLEEDQPLGTAGALGLMTKDLQEPLLVMNGDVITHAKFGNILSTHVRAGSMATMCVREYDFQVPYGVVLANNDEFMGVEEKPVHRFFVNAGIYVLDPKVLTGIPKNRRYDMTELFNDLKAQGHKTHIYPLQEYWIDVGRHEDLQAVSI
jgi:dTDP-glucose pyrophosphorylase